MFEVQRIDSQGWWKRLKFKQANYRRLPHCGDNGYWLLIEEKDLVEIQTGEEYVDSIVVAILKRKFERKARVTGSSPDESVVIILFNKVLSTASNNNSFKSPSWLIVYVDVNERFLVVTHTYGDRMMRTTDGSETTDLNLISKLNTLCTFF